MAQAQALDAEDAAVGGFAAEQLEVGVGRRSFGVGHGAGKLGTGRRQGKGRTPMSQISQVFAFDGSAGARLAGRLELPLGRPRAVALFAHCFTCSKQSAAAVAIARALAQRGIATLRFDFTGLGESEGDFAATSFASNVEDLVAAAAALGERGLAPTLLVGHSLGGAAVLAAAARLPSVTAVATLAAPADPAHVLQQLGAAPAAIERDGEAEVALGGRRIRIGRAFLDDLAGQTLTEIVPRLRKALLFLHAPRDEVVGIEHASRLFAVARHPKSFVSLDEADHLLTDRRLADYAADVIAAWAGRYLPAVPEEAPPEGQVEVAETGQGRFLQTVRIGRHRLLADEPVASGGSDLGPSPYDLLLAGLGACTAMTLRLYAERKGLPLERTRVRLDHGKVHAKDCADCPDNKVQIDRIERRIELEGPLDDAARQRLLEIANRCPVHRTLESEVRIETSLQS